MSNTANTQPTGNRAVVMHDMCSGRKGATYDWQATLIPSETVFEASLQTMLATPAAASRSRKSRRRS
jgi:hypothetical protein